MPDSRSRVVDVSTSPDNADAFVLGVLVRALSLREYEAAPLRERLAAQQLPGEHLAKTLVRQHIFRPFAVKEIELIQKGQITVDSYLHFFTKDGVALLRSQLPSESVASITFFDTGEQNEPPSVMLFSAPVVTEQQMPATAIIPASKLMRSPPPVVGKSVFVPESLIETNLGGFRLKSLLGQGVRGTVYIAHDPMLERTVAIKILNPDLAARHPNWVPRFIREASLASRLEHPNVIQVHAIAQENSFVYCAMPLIRSGSALERLQQRGPFAPLEAIRLCLQVAKFLTFAHPRQIVHGNLKPSNLLIGETGDIRVCDFYLPQPIEHNHPSCTPSIDDYLDDFRLLAATLHWLLTGRPPVCDLFTASGRPIGIVRAEGRPLNSIHPECASFIHAALFPERGIRFGNAEEILDALCAIEESLNGTDTVAIGGEDAIHTNLRELPLSRVLASGPRVERLPIPAPTVSPSSAFATNKLEIGQTLGRCLLTERVGQGSSGIVFRGLHQSLNIPVAIKVLNLANGTGVDVFRQIRTEARLLARLNHPNVVRVWDFEDDPEMPYLVLEYVEGLSLAELIQQSGRLRLDRAMQAIAQISQGLNAARKLGIVHRDVKPANILMARDGTAKLADLGLAVCVGERISVKLANVSAPIESLAGTIAYMAPEQAKHGGKIDHRSDIYALGATFYHGVTGQMPFTGKTRMEVLTKHANEPAVPPHERVPDV